MIYRAIVADSRDSSNNGRVRVMIPALSGSAVSDWIWPVISAGILAVPEAGDQVWVAFENGDRDVPVWLGATKVPPVDENEAPSIPQSSIIGLTDALDQRASLSGAEFTGPVSVVSPSESGDKGVREVTVSTQPPTGGADGDIWIVYQ